jgi:hypothetical protein
MENPAIWISIFALIFTIYSFWWMNWRQGKLIVGTPRSYAACGTKGAKLFLEFPFDFYNKGPLPIIIRNMRLLILNDDSDIPLIFTAVVNNLGNPKDRSVATQIVISGREANVIICDFIRSPGELIFEKKIYQIELQAKLNNKTNWKRLLTFPMTVTEHDLKTINNQFITYDNMSIN